MRFLATFKKSCSFERWLKLVDDLKPHMDKHGLKLIVAMQSDDGTKIYDLGETETMEGVEAFVSDPDVIRMRKEAGVDTDSQEVINSIGDYHIFPSLNALRWSCDLQIKSTTFLHCHYECTFALSRTLLQNSFLVRNENMVFNLLGDLDANHTPNLIV